MSASIQRQGLTLQMVSHQKCKLAASSERNNYILKFSFHFHEIQFRTKSCTFLTHLNGRPDTLFVLLLRTFTGKSLSEAPILASTIVHWITGSIKFVYSYNLATFVFKIFVDFLTSMLLHTQNTTLLSKIRQRFFQIMWPSQKTQTLLLG